MKRDMDLVRHILQVTELADGPVPFDGFVVGERDMATVAYHVEMMQAHGLLDATAKRGYHDTVLMGEVSGLTWDGADYLDAIRDDGIWAKTKRLVREAAGSTTMAVIKDAACMVATEAIKARLGMQ